MEKIQKILAMLNGYFIKKWFGKIEISIEAGTIVNVKVIENIKL